MEYNGELGRMCPEPGSVCGQRWYVGTVVSKSAVGLGQMSWCRHIPANLVCAVDADVCMRIPELSYCH